MDVRLICAVRKLVPVVIVLAAIDANAGELVLAERGKSAAYTIVRSAQASPSEAYAAEELRDFLVQATGVTLPIATDATPIPSKAILIGTAAGSDAALGEDGFRLKVDGARLRVIGSSKRGALYGVYELLERYAGCRWYTSWHTVVPKKDRVCVPDGLSETQVPAFMMREPFFYDVIKHIDFAARNKINGFNHCLGKIDEKFGGDSFRFGGELQSCHTFQTLMPVKEFFGTHPEYFSEIDGVRRDGRTQLCLTNPDVLRIVTERVLARIRKDPGAKFYGVSQNDWRNYCECPTCKAVDDEEESHAGTMVRFVNAVAERVEKEFPDAIIETLAYQYTRKPPKKTRLRHNVVPCLCTFECDFARPLDMSAYRENVKFCADIKGWAKQTDQLYVWDYVTDFANYTIPFANVLSLQDNIRFFRANGVKDIFEQGAYQGRHADFAELKAWLIAKWAWNPDLPVESLLQDFFNGYYGKGAPFVRRYFDELHAIQSACSNDHDRPLCIYLGPENMVLSDVFLDKAAGLWVQAIAATKDDPATSYNVRMGAFGVDYMRLFRHDKVLWLSMKPRDESMIAERRRLARLLLDRMTEANDIRLAENPERDRVLHSGLKSILEDRVQTFAKGTMRGELQESFLSCKGLGTWCSFVDDPKASDGKALKLNNTHFEWCARMEMYRIEFEPEAKYTVRVYARCEKAGDGEAFWAGVHPVPVKKVGQGGICPKTAEVGSEYAWYDVCTWVPNQDEYLWIGPGRFGADDKSAIKGVWIDKIEFEKVE